MKLKKTAIALSAIAMLTSVGSTYAHVFMAPQINSITGTINNQSPNVFTLSPNQSYVINASFSTVYPGVLDSNSTNTNTWVAAQLPMQVGSDISGQFLYNSSSNTDSCTVTYSLNHLTGVLTVSATPVPDEANDAGFTCATSTYRTGVDAGFVVTFTSPPAA
jgi:hypothetical protein